jgi:hypothetical protein
MFGVHLTVPEGVTSLDISLDFVLQPDASGFSAGASADSDLAVLSWNQVLLYPRGTTLRSISDVTKHQRLADNNEENVSPKDMLSELSDDNQQLTRFLRATHEICDEHNDVATASLIENWIDETERRTWFLSEIVAGM